MSDTKTAARDPVTLTAADGILEILFDRPPVNAINADTSRRLGQVFAAFRDDPTLRVAIVTAPGDRIFSAGWDLKAASAMGPAETAALDIGPGGFAGITRMFDLNKPVIAAVNGRAIGGGVELALACDLIVMAEGADFSLPEAARGVVADAGGLQRLPRRLPYHVAMDLLLTGRRMPAGCAPVRPPRSCGRTSPCAWRGRTSCSSTSARRACRR